MISRLTDSGLAVSTLFLVRFLPLFLFSPIAGVLADRVKAFESGMNLARYVLYQKVGPKIESILTNDREDGLGALFTPFLPSGKEVAK